MTRWRLFTSDKRHYDNIEKLKKVSNGGDILANLKHRKQRDLIIRLYRKMGKDYRPIILDKLTQLHQEPFDLISITRNFERPLTKILKNIKNQE